MSAHGYGTSAVSTSYSQDGSASATARPRASPPFAAHSPELFDESDGEPDMAVSEITDEDVQSLMEPALSRMATRLKSARTPALEKTAVMEELDGGGVFDSDPESPPISDDTLSPKILQASQAYVNRRGLPVSSERQNAAQLPIREEGPFPPKDAEDVSQLPKQTEDVSLGILPSPKIESPVLPTPWKAGPKPLQVEQSSSTPQSSLYGVFDRSRSRSLSGGADALRKLFPKNLPSIAQVGHIFSANNNAKSKLSSASFSKESPQARSPTTSSHSLGSPNRQPPHSQLRSIVMTRPSVLPNQKTSAGPSRPQTIRRATSDDSLLYHSLSRTSSLGDDTRFESHHEQVNSRAKAIRDSLQDRSSFKMPSMPSMPSMPRVPSFNFTMNFLNANTVPPARWKPNTDTVSGILPDILPGAIVKKKQDHVAKPAVAPGMVGVAVSRPEAATGTARTIARAPASTPLERAMEHLTGDIVIMGGYRGSILRSTKNNRQVWVPVKVGLNIRKVDLEVGLEPEDEERMTETIYPSGMLQNIGPVDISKRLFKRLAECENARTGKLRIHNYGYDWRLSPHLLSRQLTEFLEKLPSNQPAEDGSVARNRGALVIAHSLGGLITRHVVNQRPELFSGVIYAGVPHSCINILGPIRNGDAVLLSSRVLTAQVNFTLRTSFVLLPEDGACFFDIKTKEKYPVDFFNLEDWIKYRFSPCTDPPLPPKNPPKGFGSLLNMPGSLMNLSIPSLSVRKSLSGSDSPRKETFGSMQSSSPPKLATRAANALSDAEGGADRTLAPQMGNSTNPVSKGQNANQSVSTAVTIPRHKAIAYLERTLRETKQFKQELHFKPDLATSNRYPPLALIYGKSIPTVYGAKVDGRDGIPCSDVYDNLAFASGDGVCLAKEAMLPEGYKAVNGGRISSDRGHVTLLGDLDAVGRAIEAVLRGRRKGLGLGTTGMNDG